MDGQDEARASAVLAAMQERVIQGPHSALGVPQHATHADIRSAFLQLTKIYHPARFGRMSPEIQRMSNEVFLALRAAHDSLAKKSRTGQVSMLIPRPTTQPGQQPRTGAIPVVATRQPTGQMPTLASQHRPVSPAATGPIPTTGYRPPTPPSLSSLSSTPSSSGSGRPATGESPTVPKPTGGMPPVAQQRRTPTGPPPNAHPSASSHRPTPALGVRFSAGPAAAPSSAPASGGRTTSVMPVLDRELAPIYDLMQRGEWEQARAAITALSVKAPTAVKYRALLSYTRGREAQLARRLDEARVELDTALQLDPDLQLAKTALAELFTRRK